VTKYLIEVPHDSHKVACAVAAQIFLTSGNHFLANADWGCEDGEHKAWMIVEAASKDQARAILPPGYGPQAKIVALNRFELEEIEKVLRDHRV
jgi:hypothetical protein